MTDHVQRLTELARTFLGGDLAASAFDDQYRAIFSTLPMEVDGETFRVLEELAFACEDYVEDPELRDEAGDLDEDGLRAAARSALDRLGAR